MCFVRPPFRPKNTTRQEHEAQKERGRRSLDNEILGLGRLVLHDASEGCSKLRGGRTRRADEAGWRTGGEGRGGGPSTSPSPVPQSYDGTGPGLGQYASQKSSTPIP